MKNAARFIVWERGRQKPYYNGTNEAALTPFALLHRCQPIEIKKRDKMGQKEEYFHIWTQNILIWAQNDYF